MEHGMKKGAAGSGAVVPGLSWGKGCLGSTVFISLLLVPPHSSLLPLPREGAHLGQMFGPGTIFQGFAAKLPFHVIHFFKAKHEMVLVRARAD